MQDDGEDAWMSAMRRGDFARAWAISDHILARRIARGDFDYTLPRHRQTIWDGRPLAGKHVLVRCYHGLGDTVMFIRFAKQLRALARQVSVWAQPQLVSLIARAQGVDRVLPLHDGIPDLTYDVDIEVMELAHALRVMPEALAATVPYLHPARRAVSLHSDGRLRVGLIWAAGDWDPRRSLSIDAFGPLTRLPHIALFSLQRGTAPLRRTGFPIRDVSSDDVETLAANLAALDLLISVDTFGAHLAGAMGVPVWMLLRRKCDWRWGDTGTRTPWYPSMRLFRQPREGDWRAVVRDVATALSALASSCGGAVGTKASL